MVRSKVIAIDGPAAAGKSTIAQKVAQMYRCDVSCSNAKSIKSKY